jgi:hypothetical protein
MGLLGAATMAASPGFAHAQLMDLVYERTAMTAANERCDLFSPEISAALAAAQAQARSAALRAGADPKALSARERQAQSTGGSSNCRSPELTASAERVRSAFAGYARIQRIDYPGEIAGWRADRTGLGAIRWRLAQQVRFGDDQMTFGLAGRDMLGVVIAVAEFADGGTPYGARLLLRDQGRSTGPYFDHLSGSSQGLPLERRLPPRGALLAVAAEARSKAGADLLPKDGRAGWAFRFPMKAARELALLDPREAVAVEFLFPGDEVRRAYVEVGDFAAGKAFLTLPRR